MVAVRIAGDRPARWCRLAGESEGSRPAVVFGLDVETDPDEAFEAIVGNSVTTMIPATADLASRMVVSGRCRAQPQRPLDRLRPRDRDAPKRSEVSWVGRYTPDETDPPTWVLEPASPARDGAAPHLHAASSRWPDRLDAVGGGEPPGRHARYPMDAWQSVNDKTLEVTVAEDIGSAFDAADAAASRSWRPRSRTPRTRTSWRACGRRSTAWRRSTTTPRPALRSVIP